MTNTRSDDYSPLMKLIILIVIATLSLFIFQFFALLFVIPFSGMRMMDFINQMANPVVNPDMKSPLLIIQFISALGAFVLAPWFCIVRIEKSSIKEYFHAANLNNTALTLTVFVTLVFMIVNGVFIEWNMNWEFPGEFHAWASEKEEMLKVITTYLTSFESFGYFIGAFVVIAILPAIGEEFLFRGLIQQYLIKIFGNAHIAIWAAAIFFSAFHMQFFGFVPRLLLGAFFGYLFYFSGNLWYAVLAHFVNNGFTLIMLYIYQKGLINYDIENSESVPLETALVFLIIGVGLFYLFVRQFQFKEIKE